MLFDDLPRFLFNDASCMFQKHVVKEWCSTKLLKLAIASILEVAASFVRWIFNLHIKDKEILSEVHNISIYLPSCAEYPTIFSYIDATKIGTLSAQCWLATKKFTFGELLFESSDIEVIVLK